MMNRANSLLLVIAASTACALHAGEPTPAPTVRDLNMRHLFTPPTCRAEWKDRAEQLRQRILFAAGLWPKPEFVPLEPVITGRQEGPDYIIENVVLTTRPGFHLCGNLYRPKGKTGPFPAVANPHGHWDKGRTHQEADVPEAAPGEKPAPGKANLVAIGVTLARNGIICFSYDMVGYVDTLQMKHRTFAKDDLRAWSWNVNLLGLQLLNGMRVVDFLESLPDVDRSRIGATGASGGGSQTFLLAAVDPRIAVSVPVNMVSAYMQGGCLCENGPGLRVGTDNAEIASLFAPKPQLLVSCLGDWTKNVPKEEYPAIRNIYSLFDAPKKIASVQFNYQHNYNGKSRDAMVAFFVKQFYGTDAYLKEAPFEVTAESLRVWTEKHPRPTTDFDEEKMREAMIGEAKARFLADLPQSDAEWERFSSNYRESLLISLVLAPDMIPATRFILPKKPKGSVVVVTMADDAAAHQMAADLKVAVEARGFFFIEERLEPIAMPAAAMLEKFYSCYNQTPVGARVRQVDDTANSLAIDLEAPVHMIALGRAGPIALLALGATIWEKRAAIDLNGMTEDDAAFLPALYAPGLRRAGDVRSAAVIAARAPLLVFNDKARMIAEVLDRVKAETVKKNVEARADGMTTAALTQWLFKE